MNNRNFATLNELLEHKQSLQLSSNLLFPQYLSKIYTNLLKREEICHHSYSIKIQRHSQPLKTNNIMIPTIKNPRNRNYGIPKTKIIDKGLSLKTFLEYFDVQELIGERIFKYFNKSKTNKLDKNDFCKGFNDLYYGDVKNLIKFTFFLADFNDDGIMYKADMKLLLAYIPAPSEFSQKLCLKQISEIVNNFFKEKIDKPKEGDEKEINYDTYLKYIEEYIEKNNSTNNLELLQDYNNNAPFFYYISILSYLFKNNPFSPKNVDNFIYSKNKIKLKLRNEGRSMSQKKILSTTIKNNLNSSILITTRTDNKLENSSNGLFTVEKNKNKLLESVKSIGQKNLFNMKKSSSQINIRRNSIKNCTNLSMIVKKKKEDKKMNLLPIINSKEIKIQKNIFKNASKKKKNTLSPIGHEMKTYSPLINPQNPDINKISASPDFAPKDAIFNHSNSNDTKGSSNHSGSNTNLRQFHLSDSKLPSILQAKDMNKGIPLSVEAKPKNDNLADEPGEFVLCEYSGSDEDSINKISSKNIEFYDEESQMDSNEVYLYKVNEDDIQSIMTKYYAKLSEKEILFFSSDLKNELCDLWYIYKTFISTGKEKVNNTNYFTINITYNNNFISKLYFLNEQICQNFAKKIKNSIKSFNFEEHYEMLEKLGQGRFGKVSKCKKKSSGEIFAVKVINKLDLKLIDLELIEQEKNYLQLIKHPNILSLKDYHEDRKNIYIITDCCNGGDLLTFIDEKNKEKVQISEKLAAKITKKIAEGIRYLNYFGIIHRDIKPENILFVDKNDIKSLKIIDLGVSQTLTYGEMASEPLGTNGYICPEIYLHHNYSFKIDIWSLGVILYLMITGGILPFDDDKLDDKVIGRKVVYLQQEYPTEYFGQKSKGLINLLDKMLEKNDQKRISINELIKDSWFGILKK